MDTALRLSSVTKTFGDKMAVQSLDLAVPRGALYGFIGPNGAGKTTTIRMIMSILFPDSGELSVMGGGSALNAKDRIGYLPEERGVHRKMAVAAFLTYMAQLKGVASADAAARVSPLLERVGLPGTEKKKCEDLSKGMLQRIQVAAAIIHRPELIILDEPLSGLDPVSTRLLRQVIVDEHRRGATIMLSTHVMVQAEEMCQHIVMIHQGRKVLDEPMAGLRRQFDVRRVLFEPLDPHADISAVRRLPAVEQVESSGESYDITLREGTDPAAAIQAITAACPPARIELARLRLEDIFVGIVSEGRDGTAARQLRASLRTPGAEGVTV